MKRGSVGSGALGLLQCLSALYPRPLYIGLSLPSPVPFSLPHPPHPGLSLSLSEVTRLEVQRNASNASLGFFSCAMPLPCIPYILHPTP